MVAYDRMDIARCEHTLLEIKHAFLENLIPFDAVPIGRFVVALRIDKIIGLLNEAVTQNFELTQKADDMEKELDEFYQLGFPDLDDLSDQDKQEITALLTRQEERRKFNEQSGLSGT